MSAARDKIKSMGKAFLGSVATVVHERLSRDVALSTLKIDTKNDQYHDVIGKLAAAIVELQEENLELAAAIVELQSEVRSK